MPQKELRFAISAALPMLLSALGISHAQISNTQTWPQQTVKLVVPFGAGSAPDITARLFGEPLSKRWGQNVVVEKRMVLLSEPIKQLGTHKVPIRVYKGVEPEITVEIVAEG